MKKLFAIVLTLVLFLGLSACQVAPPEKVTQDTELPILGTWEGAVDMSKLFEDLLQVEVEESMPIAITYTFAPDNWFVSQVDQEATAEAMSMAFEVFWDSLVKICEDLGYSLEEALSEQGMTKEEFREQTLGSAEMEAMLMMLGPKKTGFYKYEAGKVCIFATKKAFYEEDFTECDYIQLDGDRMYITDIEKDGQNLSAVMPGVFPIVFTKKQ